MGSEIQPIGGSIEEEFDFGEEVYDFKSSTISAEEIIKKRAVEEANMATQKKYAIGFGDLVASAQAFREAYIPLIAKLDIKKVIGDFAQARKALKTDEKILDLKKFIDSLETNVLKIINDDKNSGNKLSDFDKNSFQKLITDIKSGIEHYDFSKLADIKDIKITLYGNINGYTANHKLTLGTVKLFEDLISKINSFSTIKEPSLYSEVKSALNYSTNADVDKFVISFNNKMKSFHKNYNEVYKLDTRSDAEKLGGVDGDTRAPLEKVTQGDILEGIKEGVQEMAKAGFKVLQDGYDSMTGTVRHDDANPIVKDMRTESSTTTGQVSTMVIDFSNAVPLSSPIYARKVHMIYQKDIASGVGALKTECYKFIANAQTMEQTQCSLDFSKESTDCLKWKQGIEIGFKNCEAFFPMLVEHVEQGIQDFINNSLSSSVIINEATGTISHIKAGKVIGETKENDNQFDITNADGITYNPLLEGGEANAPALLSMNGATTVEAPSGNLLLVGSCGSHTGTTAD